MEHSGCMRKKVLVFVLALTMGLSACSKNDSASKDKRTESENKQITSGVPTDATDKNDLQTSPTQMSAEFDANNPTEIPSVTEKPSVSPAESADKYGCLQEIIDTYGFPIYIRMMEGQEQTVIELSKDSAKREWMSNVDYKVLENLAWSIDKDHLTISGDWSEEFTINSDSWSAVSSLGGKEYRFYIYDKEEGRFVFLDQM